jgi:lantibiotic modifying enzyme
MPAIDDLTGFSHGAAGIALSLLELWGITKEARFREVAEAGFSYE